MRVIHLLKHGVRGGGNVHVAVDLACAQSDAGHDVVFAAARPSYSEILEAHGVRVVEVVEPTSARQGPRAGLAVGRLLRSVRPDVVNAHMMSSALLAAPACRLLGIPLVTTMHNSFDKHSGLMRVGRVVIAVSDAERRLLISRGFDPARVVTVVNGAAASPREVLQDEDLQLRRPCVMTLSGLHPRKAVGDVLEAFAMTRGAHADWHLNVVGWGADRRRLEMQVAELELQDSVHLLGSTLAPRPLLEQADIFATATLADPCPLTVMEARAAGCAVVATDVGGIPETLEHGRAGTVVPPHDPATMAVELRRLMGDPELLRGRRAAALAGAEFFTVRRMAEDYLKVYQSLLAGGGLYRPSLAAA